jgi:hypothetical protein
MLEEFTELACFPIATIGERHEKRRLVLMEQVLEAA